MTKKVIFLADSVSTQTAGIHYFGKQLIESIMARFPKYSYTSIATAQLDIEQIEQIVLPIKSYIPAHLRIRQLTTIPKTVRQLDPDIVIELAHFGPFALPSHIKRMTVIHDLSAVTHRQFHPLQSHLVQKLTLPNILSKAHGIITNSNFTKSEIIRVYKTPESKIQVLYPAIRSIQANAPENTVDPKDQSKYFLCVGTIEPRKNHITVVKAFEKIFERFPECRLIIAGKDGWKNKSFYTYLNNSKAKSKIELTGYINNQQLKRLYQGAFAFISASHFEGFGMPIVEASRFSLPLLIANNSAQLEIAEDSALLFDSNNIQDLAMQMERILSDEQLSFDLKQKSTSMSSAINKKQKEQLAKLRIA